MKRIIQYFFAIVFLSFFFTGCEVGITPLDQSGNEVNVVTTGTPNRDGDVQTINIEIPDVNIELDVSVKLDGNGSEYFTITLDKTGYGYQGQVTLNPDTAPILYIENKTYDFFARTVVNGQKLCDGNISKTIYRTEVAPVVKNQTITLDEDTNISIDLIATSFDKNDDNLTYILKKLPKHGDLDGTNSHPIYIPNPNYFGTDSFAYVANDGHNDSNIATVNIIINDVIDTIADTTAPTITLNGTNQQTIEAGSPYVELNATADDGSNVVIDSTAVNTNTVGDYNVTYNATDANGNVAVEVIRTVSVVDTTAPVITLTGTNPQTIEARQAYTELNATADDGSSVVIDSITVDTNTEGNYTVTYNATDRAGNSATQVIRNVNVVDTTAPVISLKGGDITLSVGQIYIDAGASASDNIDGDITSRVRITGDTVDTVIPDNYIIRYDVNDSAGNVAIQMIRVVTVTNNKPVAIGTTYTMDEDTTLTLTLQGSDVDGGAVLTYRIVGDPSNGSIVIFGDTITYTPDSDYFGTDSFTFDVRDEFNATSNVVNIDITINDIVEPNTMPIVEDINISMDGNTSTIGFDLNASDADVADILIFSIVSSPAFGTLIVDDNLTGHVSYDRGTYTGNISFTYKINDGTIDSNIATAYITSNVSNTPPISHEQSVNLDVSGTPTINLNASDVDVGDILTYRIGVPPSYGSVSRTGNQVTYTPDPNYTGNDSFTFITNDGIDDSNEALVYIEVGNTQLASHLFAWCKANDEELWRTDGTQSGITIVKNIRSGGSAIPQSFVKINNTYFFIANDGVHGQELWKSQGTEGSTVLVKDIKTKGNGHTNPHNLIDVNGTLFFAAKDGINGIELWKSDGTALGTKMVKNINKKGHSKPENLTNVNGILYFTANDGKNGRELWKSDGTVEGTNQVNDINSNGSSNPQYLTNINGVLWFSADDGGTTQPNPIGRELWYYNTNISDIASGFTNRGRFDIFGGSESSNPEELFNYNGTLVFSAETQTFGRELWISDGRGIRMHSNYAGDNTIFGDFRNRSSSPHSFVVVNDILYFSAYQILNGYNLRKIDSINDTTIDDVLYMENGQGFHVSNPTNLILLNDTLFFSTYHKSEDQNGNTTDEWIYFWKASDDSAQRDKLFHPADSIRNIVNINDILYFVVTEKNDVDKLWRYDGNNFELLQAGCQ